MIRYILILLLFAVAAQAANQTVEEDGGGDQLTLDAACDVIGAGETITIQGAWDNPDTVEVDISTNCIITATGDARVTTASHAAGGTHYRLHGDGDHCITIADATAETSIDGIEIKQVGSGASDECIRLADDGGVLTITNCILSSAYAEVDQDGIYAGLISCTVNLENDIIYSFQRAGCQAQIYTYDSGKTQTWNANSCSFTKCGINGETSGGAIAVDADHVTETYSINAHNTWGFCSFANNDTFNEYDAGANVTWGISYSIDDDGSITDRDAGAVNCQENVTIEDTDQGAGAYVIVNGDIDGAAPWDLALTDLDNTKNVAQDEHAVKTAEGMDIPAADIDATARPDNTNYDVGAYEVDTGGAPPAGTGQVIMISGIIPILAGSLLFLNRKKVA